MNLVRGERQAYSDHRELAFSQPKKYACCIVDGMDLFKSSIPHPWRECKGTEAIPHNLRVVLRLLGVKLHHDQGTKHFGFVFPPYVKGTGTSAIVEVLLRLAHEMGNEKPPHLFVQVDNCSENRSKVFFAVADWLVTHRIFESVQVNFLVVGHTHEDIDQWFSVFAKAQSKKDIWTVDEFLTLLGTFSERDAINAKVIYVTSRHDYDAWLEKDIDPEFGYYGRGVVPHEFIIRHQGGKAHMFYKPWSTSERMKPEGNQGIHVLLAHPPLDALKWDKFYWEWDENGECEDRVKAVCDILAPHCKEEWHHWFSTLPKTVEEQTGKWSPVVLQPLPPQEVIMQQPAVAHGHDERVLVSHAGLPRVERNRIIRRLMNEERIELEEEHAKTLQPLEKGDFVVFLTDRDFWDEDGFGTNERNLKIGVGKYVSDTTTLDPEHEVQVALYRCPSGDVNRAWVPATRVGTKTAQRMVGIPRGSIIFQVADLFTRTKVMRANCKRDLGSYSLSPYICGTTGSELVLRA